MGHLAAAGTACQQTCPGTRPAGLAFFWSGATTADGLWLLDTSAPGARLLSGHRLLPQTLGPDEVQSA